MKPLIKGMIEDERVGEEEGGLAFAEVELDSTLIGDLGVKYMVRTSQTIVGRGGANVVRADNFHAHATCIQ